MTDDGYKAAWERERQARFEAEKLLEDSSRELYQKTRLLSLQQGQMIKAEKLATLGQLSAGIAHEINNPLAYVNSNIFTLHQYNEALLKLLRLTIEWQEQQLLPEAQLKVLNQLIKEEDLGFLEEDLPALKADIKDGLERVIDIIANLKAFTRTREDEHNPTDLNSVVTSTIKLLGQNFTNSCRVETSLDSALPKVKGNANELSQVLINLMQNALHAVEDKDDALITVQTLHQGDHILLTVSDNGCGMNAEEKSQIFEPFFTTKSAGKGTGMGMAVVQSILEQHQAIIKVESEPDNGSRFLITLPTTPE